MRRVTRSEKRKELIAGNKVQHLFCEARRAFARISNHSFAAFMNPACR